MTLRENVWDLTVDPLNDFGHSEGAFGKAYPTETSTQAIIPALRSQVMDAQGRCQNVLVQSIYEPGRFIADNPLLEELCVDGTWGRESMIDPKLFQRVFTKFDNSLFSSPEIQAETAPPAVAIAKGVTLTSCLYISIKNAVDRTLEKTLFVSGGDAEKFLYPVPTAWQNTQWIVPKDGSAYRPAREANAQEMFYELSLEPGIHVTETHAEALDLATRIAA